MKEDVVMKIISNNGLFEIICGDIDKKSENALTGINMEYIAKNIMKEEKLEKCNVYYAYDKNILTVHKNNFSKNPQKKIPEEAQLKCMIVEENKDREMVVHKFFEFCEDVYYNDYFYCPNNLHNENLCNKWGSTLCLQKK